MCNKQPSSTLSKLNAFNLLCGQTIFHVSRNLWFIRTNGPKILVKKKIILSNVCINYDLENFVTIKNWRRVLGSKGWKTILGLGGVGAMLRIDLSCGCVAFWQNLGYRLWLDNI